MRLRIRATDAIGLDEHDFSEHFVRASGPGGQNVNKVATAVELRVDIRKSSLPDDVKERLIAVGGRQVTTAGVLVIDSRVHRSQAQNRAAARARLAALLKLAAKPPKKRRATQPGPAAREKRFASKRLKGAIKQSRSRRSGDE